MCRPSMSASMHFFNCPFTRRRPPSRRSGLLLAAHPNFAPQSYFGSSATDAAGLCNAATAAMSNLPLTDERANRSFS